MKKLSCPLLALSVASLICSCTTHKVKPWTEWEEKEYKRITNYSQPTDFCFTKRPVLTDAESIENADIMFAFQARRSRTDIKLFERSQRTESHTHYPFISPRLVKKEGLLYVFLFPFGVLDYVLNGGSGRSFNKTTNEYEYEDRTEISEKDDWYGIHQLDEYIEIPELAISTRARSNPVRISLKKSKLTPEKLTEKLMALDELTIHLKNSGANETLNLAGFHKAEETRRQALALKKEKEKQRELARAEAQRKQEAAIAEQHRKRKKHFSSLCQEVATRENAQEFSRALDYQRQLIQLVQKHPDDASVSLSDALKRGIELAARAGDIDAVSELMAINTSSDSL